MISTRLTEKLGIKHPIISAPMAFAAGGALASAVTRGGGLGLIGGGYGDAEWLAEQFDTAGDAPVGVGFITWSVQRSPELVTETLRRRPAAVMLSFGDPRAFADEIHAAGATLICQCQNLDHVRNAVTTGADVIVAQGSEAGGHGALRGTLSLVPEVADFLRRESPDTVLAAAGGIADGRGLAAALTLGADGVLMGTRLWASTEAQVHPSHHDAMLAADGDGTIRTRACDVVRGLPWSTDFTARIRRNTFTERWHGHEDELAESISTAGPDYGDAWAAGDIDNAGVFFGEAAGIIHEIEQAVMIIDRIVSQAEDVLRTSAARCN
ncbi:NAD(P)H-dependent flavin oxidoreductase [Jongsikchunia kroppenstedtii]|uniref:NAD(P)H-dependent flavin oxidoreductase n=1 Tax=Jongsikchunia kroppenstedtii TaxID=1121721 RepID=UPI00036861C5|nr:nitronate monooxygenase [Jongsikchunia kroppenstedtii]